MTDLSRLSDIETRCARATAAPWSYRSQQYDDWGMVRGPDDGGMPVATTCMTARYTEAEANAARAAKSEPAQVHANGLFITHAREDIPYLLSALRASLEESASLREALGLINLGYWTNGETGEERVADLKSIARTALTPDTEKMG